MFPLSVVDRVSEIPTQVESPRAVAQAGNNIVIVGQSGSELIDTKSGQTRTLDYGHYGDACVFHDELYVAHPGSKSEGIFK